MAMIRTYATTRKLGLAGLLTTTFGFALFAEQYGGIEFPQGAISFADSVSQYEPSYSGGAVPTRPNFTDPSMAVGAPDYSGGTWGTGSVSLGSGGRLVLSFHDNTLTGSDSPDPDLHIFEVGPDVEDTFVEISSDGSIWHSVGKVYGSNSSIDIDSYGFNSSNRFCWVRLTDDPDEGNTTGATVGADIDAVGAIHTLFVPEYPPTTLESYMEGVPRTNMVVSFQTYPDRGYALQKSHDLAAWSDFGDQITGNGSTYELPIPIEETGWPRLFLRLMFTE